MERKLLRILDANFNRSKEGLRVCEDICRFYWDEKTSTRAIKLIRHKLSDIICSLNLEKFIEARDIVKDVGKSSSKTEFKRSDVEDIFYANMQRVKESLRVLEEFAKLIRAQSSQDLKTLRYKVYELERKIAKRS